MTTEAVLKFIHLSDIHLTTPGQSIHGRLPNENFDLALDHILKDHGDAAFMVITGDLSDWGDREDYERLEARLARFPIPAHLCIGNHDNRDTFLSVFPDLADKNGFVQERFDVAGHRGLLLDTWAPQTHAGRYCETRLNWLRSELESHPGPFFLFMHHNPIPTHIIPLDTIRLLDDGPFRALIGEYRERVRHIFFGHCHLPLAGSVAGVPTSSLRGTNHASYPTFSEPELLSSSDLPQAYGVVFAAPDYVTVHMVEFGYAGPLRIEGVPDYAAWDRTKVVR
jgi:3',5'-cyclic AMP phosphodiesterase CpdA